MAGRWQGSTRRTQLPSDWAVRRAAVFARDGHRCRWIDEGQRCQQSAAEVDHIKRGGNHELPNLRALCTWHHARKTAAEGNAARTRLTQRRPPEVHPGMTPPRTAPGVRAGAQPA